MDFRDADVDTLTQAMEDDNSELKPTLDEIESVEVFIRSTSRFEVPNTAMCKIIEATLRAEYASELVEHAIEEVTENTSPMYDPEED